MIRKEPTTVKEWGKKERAYVHFNVLEEFCYKVIAIADHINMVIYYLYVKIINKKICYQKSKINKCFQFSQTEEKEDLSNFYMIFSKIMFLTKKISSNPLHFYLKPNMKNVLEYLYGGRKKVIPTLVIVPLCGLSGIKLIFFIEACITCFGFLMKTVMIAQQ